MNQCFIWLFMWKGTSSGLSDSIEFLTLVIYLYFHLLVSAAALLSFISIISIIILRNLYQKIIVSWLFSGILLFRFILWKVIILFSDHILLYLFIMWVSYILLSVWESSRHSSVIISLPSSRNLSRWFVFNVNYAGIKSNLHL